jgi:hypothetical protein
MSTLSVERTTEMLNELEDFETEWNQFEFFGNQQITFEGIYDKYIKKVQR